MADACEEMEGVGMLLSNHHIEGTITSTQEEEAYSIRRVVDVPHDSTVSFNRKKLEGQRKITPSQNSSWNTWQHSRSPRSHHALGSQPSK